VFMPILRFFGWAFSWATLGLFVGAIMLGGVFYMFSSDLPEHAVLDEYQPKTLSRVYSGRGALMDEFAKERRIFTAIDEIPDVVKHAFISAEDKNFYDHQGFDLRGIAAAGVEFVTDRMRGGSSRARGASTIPQQVAKIFLLDGSRTAERKIKELIISTRMVATLGRDRVLELYLITANPLRKLPQARRPIWRRLPSVPLRCTRCATLRRRSIGAIMCCAKCRKTAFWTLKWPRPKPRSL